MPEQALEENMKDDFFTVDTDSNNLEREKVSIKLKETVIQRVFDEVIKEEVTPENYWNYYYKVKQAFGSLFSFAQDLRFDLFKRNEFLPIYEEFVHSNMQSKKTKEQKRFKTLII